VAALIWYIEFLAFFWPSQLPVMTVLNWKKSKHNKKYCNC